MSTLSVEAIREQAARWVARLNEGELSEANRQELHRWLLRDERHEKEFRALMNVVALASEMPADTRITLDADTNVVPFQPTVQSSSPLPTSSPMPRSSRRFQGMAVAAGLVLAVAAGWFVINTTSQNKQTHITGTGQTQTVTFEDGSVAYLNTRTRLQWVGNKEHRKVALLSGEALFDVVHDPNRPFSVIVDKSVIHVLGTRFNVYRKKSDEVVVTVLEGNVEVREDNSADTKPAWTRKLSAGQQIAYSSIGLTRDVQSVNALNTIKWREGVLELTDEPLPNVLDELTRYTDQRIVIKDPQLAQLRLGGALSTRDVRAALARIEKLAPITVAESGNTFTLDHREEAREERK